MVDLGRSRSIGVGRGRSGVDRRWSGSVGGRSGSVERWMILNSL